MSPHSHSHYPDLAKSERKDPLVPDPQEYDMSDPDEIKIMPKSAKGRLEKFDRLAMEDATNVTGT